MVFGAGTYYDSDDVSMPADAYVVAADGGFDHARDLGITPDVVVGDFDSIEQPIADAGDAGDAGSAMRTITLPPLKDDPDMLSALKIGWAASCREFHIWGGLGGRIDHTIANLQLLAMLASHGAAGYLHGNGNAITAITDGELHFAAHTVPGDGTRMVSVFALSDKAAGVTEQGLKYQLTDATMHNTQVNGVSNEFLNMTEATISVRQGTLAVTFPADSPMPEVTLFHEMSGDIGKLDTTISTALAVTPR